MKTAGMSVPLYLVAGLIAAILCSIAYRLAEIASTLEKYRRDRWTADCGRWDEEDDELIESEGDHE